MKKQPKFKVGDKVLVELVIMGIDEDDFYVGPKPHENNSCFVDPEHIHPLPPKKRRGKERQ